MIMLKNGSKNFKKISVCVKCNNLDNIEILTRKAFVGNSVESEADHYTNNLLLSES